MSSIAAKMLCLGMHGVVIPKRVKVKSPRSLIKL
jgi:hypothetical protein